jgi:aminoacyl tRNA synthase complex-interacting multifunctional protein 1
MERKAESLKKTEKAAGKSSDMPVKEMEPPSVSAMSAASALAATNVKSRKREKEKGGAATDEARNTKVSGPAKPIAEEPAEPVPSMIDLRVGHIVDGGLTCICYIENAMLINT